MSIQIKDYVVGKQKEDALPGAEAYAYARQMQAIREANPFATERVMQFRYLLFGYLFAFVAFMFIVVDSLMWSGVFSFLAFGIGLYGKYTAVEVPLRR